MSLVVPFLGVGVIFLVVCLSSSLSASRKPSSRFDSRYSKPRPHEVFMFIVLDALDYCGLKRGGTLACRLIIFLIGCITLSVHQIHMSRKNIHAHGAQNGHWFSNTKSADWEADTAGKYAERLKQIEHDDGTFGLEVELFTFGGMLPLGSKILGENSRSQWEEHSCTELMLNVSVHIAIASISRTTL